MPAKETSSLYDFKLRWFQA